MPVRSGQPCMLDQNELKKLVGYKVRATPAPAQAQNRLLPPHTPGRR
jgi:hypothetical protein